MSWQARQRVELYKHRASAHDPNIARRGCDALTKRIVASVIADAANAGGAPVRGIGRRSIAERTGLTLDAVARAIAYLVHDDGLVFVVKPGGPALPAWYGIDLARCPQARVPGTREGSQLVDVSEDRDARPREDRGARVPGTRDYELNDQRCAGGREDATPADPAPVDVLPMDQVRALVDAAASETGWKPRRPRASVFEREAALAARQGRL